MQFLNRIMLVVCILVLQGCLPETAPKIIQGPISGNVAAQRMSKVRSDSGPSYRVTHVHDGDEFEAAWEIGNALKRSAQRSEMLGSTLSNASAMKATPKERRAR